MFLHVAFIERTAWIQEDAHRWSAWSLNQTLMPVAPSSLKCSHSCHSASIRETASGWKYHSRHHFAARPSTSRAGSSCSCRNSSAEPWTHLHRFIPEDPFAPLRPVNGEVPAVRQWLPGRECEEPGDRPEEECTLEQLLALGSGAAFYEYDFGDSWPHRLELMSRRPAKADTPPARLTDGARRGPMEDSGGLPGYEDHGRTGRSVPS